VDKFRQPNNKNVKPDKLRHIINYTNRFHGMYTFNEILKHMAEKYGCVYIESPKGTTRTCSICGHKNPHLPLSQRYLICEECGTIIDRDENASKNCYMYI
jgi:putative transposase